MMHIHELNLKDLQPSQFYISEKKLRDIEAWLNPAELSCFEPIPVKLLDGRPVMTDGHTRAVAALRAGLEAVPLVWDEDELSWDMYRACVAACREQGITSPCQLLSRIIPEEEYRAVREMLQLRSDLEEGDRRGVYSKRYSQLPRQSVLQCAFLFGLSGETGDRTH